MIILLRILSLGAFGYLLWNGISTGSMQSSGVDLSPGAFLAVMLVLAIFTAIVWAPYIGAKMAAPLTYTLTDGSYLEERNYAIALIRWLQRHGHRRLVLLGCFLEGLNRPKQPLAFMIGMKSAAPGSWLEKVFAREVFRFDNARHCVEAHQVLRRQGIDPGFHARAEVNLLLLAKDTPPAPDRLPRELPVAPPPPSLQRNQRIRLFDDELNTTPKEPVVTPSAPASAEAAPAVAVTKTPGGSAFLPT